MEAKQLSKPPTVVPTPVGVSHPTATPDSLFSASMPAQDLTSSTPSNNAMVARDVKEDVKPDLASDIKRHSTNVMNSLQSFRQKIVKRNDYTPNDSRLSSDFTEETNSVAGPSSQASNTLQAPTRPSPLTRSPTPNPSSTVTPLSNIGEALRAYTPHFSMVLMMIFPPFKPPISTWPSNHAPKRRATCSEIENRCRW